MKLASNHPSSRSEGYFWTTELLNWIINSVNNQLFLKLTVRHLQGLLRSSLWVIAEKWFGKPRTGSIRGGGDSGVTDDRGYVGNGAQEVSVHWRSRARSRRSTLINIHPQYETDSSKTDLLPVVAVKDQPPPNLEDLGRMIASVWFSSAKPNKHRKSSGNFRGGFSIGRPSWRRRGITSNFSALSWIVGLFTTPVSTNTFENGETASICLISNQNKYFWP